MPSTEEYARRGLLGALSRWKDHAPAVKAEPARRYKQYPKGPLPTTKKRDANGNLYESVRVSRRQCLKRWRAANKEKVRAHNAVLAAVKKGALKKLPCAKCGDLIVHGHHHNGYENPLDVVWLCPAHHRKIHSGQEGEVNIPMADPTAQDVVDTLTSVLPILANVDADADKQINKIADLQAIIASGGAVTKEQLQQIADLSMSIKNAASSVDVKVP